MSKLRFAVLGMVLTATACVGEAPPSGSGRETPSLSHANQAPGQTGNTPGQSGQTPGQSGALPPGQSGNTPNGGGSPNTMCAGLTCDDNNPCTADSCDPAAGCVHANLPDGPFAGSTATTCGVGACGATGQTVCANGAVVDSCAPRAPASSDATCDGVDDDCNGAADEDYVATSTSCGTGACAATGVTSCVNGAVVDSCSAGTPAASDVSCNNVDDDCNGAVDDGYVPVATSCGTGACAATGVTSCVGGAVIDSCRPGAPPCEAPTVIFTMTPPATTSSTNAEFAWTYTGLPTTVRFVTSDGYDSGVVSSLHSGFGRSGLRPGTYTFTVTAFNAVGSGSASYTWTVTPPPVGGARIVGWSGYSGGGLRTVDLNGVATSLDTTDTHLAQWSPNGQRIAYRSTAVRELWVQNADGTDKRNLSSAAGGVAINYFAWSPDSTKLVFDVISAGFVDVWVVNADGTGLRNLTGTPSLSEDQGSFTPDGRIVYRNGGDNRSIWTMNADGTNKARLIATTTTDPVLSRPMFSPDGNFVYVISFGGTLLRYTAAGLGRTPISNGPVTFTEYVLSPDGHRISFLRNNQVWVIDNADGAATVRQLSTQSTGSASAYQITTWSPDGATIVFDCNGPTGMGTRLCRVDANATSPVPASFIGFDSFQFPHWSGYNPARGG